MGTRADTADPELGRTIGTFQLMMFGVGATVGTGIFFVLPESVPDAGPAVVVAFLLAGLAAGLSAICYAEMASSIPVSGSTYSYAYHSMGELVAMIIAACVILEYGVAAGAVAVGWSGYFNELLDKTIGWSLPDALSYSPIPVEDGTTGLVNLPAIVLVFLCTLLLIRGASESAKVNTVMVLIKLSVLGLFIVIGLSAFQADRFDNFWASGSAGITAAAGTIFFSFIGLDAVSTAGEEVKDPQTGAAPRHHGRPGDRRDGLRPGRHRGGGRAAARGLLEQGAAGRRPVRDHGERHRLGRARDHPGRRRRDLDLLGHPGHAVRADAHPVRDGPRPDAPRQVRRGGRHGR